jgi:hypothetical protein
MNNMGGSKRRSFLKGQGILVEKGKLKIESD